MKKTSVYITAIIIGICLMYSAGTYDISPKYNNTGDVHYLTHLNGLDIGDFLVTSPEIDSIEIEATNDKEVAMELYYIVVYHLSYDSIEASNVLNGGTGTSLLNAWIDGTGICAHYAYLFAYLCDINGIPCNVIYYDNHAFNLAYIDREWIYIDCTAGDNTEGVLSGYDLEPTEEVEHQFETIAEYDGIK
jgi:transglutaminase/protease-like cytokinesis protein 3